MGKFTMSMVIFNSYEQRKLAAELCQELRHEYNSCDVPCRDDVELTTMSQFPKPEVVGLLIQKSRQWQAKRITPFDVQLLSEGRLTN